MADYGTILSGCLQKPFNIDRYRNFIVNFLNGTELKQITSLRSAEIFSGYSYYVQGYALVGEYTDPNRNRVGIYAVKLNAGRDIEKARSKQRNFIAKLLVDNNFDAAIAAFYLNEDSKWRLSFVRLDYEFAKGKVSKNLTPAKRYSYLVGKDEPCHTAMESLLPIFADENFTPTIDSIEQAFSIEKVTKQFFEKYKEKYIELKEYLEHTTCFVEESKQRGFTSEQFAKKLMGQIVFLYFLQKKGWLGVNAIKKEITEREYKNLFYFNAVTRGFAERIYTKVADNVYKLNPAELRTLNTKEEESVAKAIKGRPWGEGSRTFVRDLFKVAKDKNGNFFDEYLEPLFYEGLNKKREADNYYAPLHCRIPFLNGGLFEPLDNYDWENNFFSIPNEMFSNADTKGAREADGILDIFDRYNFTMNEDEPLEKEVAVDPEMLGKIFENLLDVTDRKSKGAFYTPREIVHYMCQESLTNYIVNTVGTPYEDTKDFVVYGEIMKDEDCSRESTYGMCSLLMADSIFNNLKAIDDALADVRVADPAVGSGAFPMGMLSEIVKLREIITEYMARDLCLQPQYKGAEKAGALRAAIWKLRNETRNSYNLKKETMRNSIYAVDIEPSAVDIAKLRLWLTLVVEQEIDPNDPYNDSPVALPNLDCNIMCGNSLIDEFEGIDLSFDDIIGNDIAQTTIIGNSLDTDLEILFKLQRDYFYTDNHDDKFKLKQEIESVKERILALAFTSASEEKKRCFDIANTLHSTPFFLWKLNFAKVFKEKGGFDIVIGNPPYVDSEEMVRTMKTQRELYNSIYKVAKGNWDLFLLFIELSIKLLKVSGCNSFILPNKLLAANYAKETRKLMSKYGLLGIRDYSDVKVFESAAVYPIVYFLVKEKTALPCAMQKMLSFDKIKFISNIDQEEVLKQDNWDQFFVEDNLATKLISKLNILPKLETIATVKGAATVNEAYEIKNILLEDEFEFEKHLKFINTGTIDRYCSLWESAKTQYIKTGYHKPVLSKLALKNLYSQRYEESLKDKIIIGGMCKVLECYLDNGQYLAGKSTTIVFDSNIDLKVLVGILNSKLMSFFYATYFKSLSLAGGFFRFGTPQIKLLPIAKDKDNIYKSLSEVVNKLNNQYDIDLDRQIDDIVYKLYGLTDEEIAIVEEAIK